MSLFVKLTIIKIGRSYYFKPIFFDGKKFYTALMFSTLLQSNFSKKKSKSWVYLCIQKMLSNTEYLLVNII